MLVFNDFKKGGSEPYTKTSGCIISEKNGYRESLASEKKMKVVMPYDDANGLKLPILLPAGLSLEDFMGMHVFFGDGDKLFCDTIIYGHIDETESGNTFYKNSSKQYDYYYDPITGLFFDDSFYNDFVGDIIDNAPLIVKYMTGEHIPCDVDVKFSMENGRFYHGIGRIELSKPIEELVEEIGQETPLIMSVDISDTGTEYNNMILVEFTAGSVTGSYYAALCPSGPFSIDLQFTPGQILSADDTYLPQFIAGSGVLTSTKADEEGKVFVYSYE